MALFDGEGLPGGFPNKCGEEGVPGARVPVFVNSRSIAKPVSCTRTSYV